MTLVTCFRDMLFKRKSRGLFKQADRGSKTTTFRQPVQMSSASSAAEANAVDAGGVWQR